MQALAQKLTGSLPVTLQLLKCRLHGENCAGRLGQHRRRYKRRLASATDRQQLRYLNVAGVGLAISFAFDLKLQSAAQYFILYHSALILSRSRSHLFRTFKAPGDLLSLISRPSVAQRLESLSPSRRAVKSDPLRLLKHPLSRLQPSDCFRRNERKIYHTPPKLSNPCRHVLSTLRHQSCQVLARSRRNEWRLYRHLAILSNRAGGVL